MALYHTADIVLQAHVLALSLEPFVPACSKSAFLLLRVHPVCAPPRHDANCCTCCRPPEWHSSLNHYGMVATEELHVALGVKERFHRFREVSGVPAIEAAAAELNMRLAARGAYSTHPRLPDVAHVRAGPCSLLALSLAT